MPIIKQPHGGAIFQAEKGQTKNPNGRPKQPRKLKEFIKELETEDDELLFPEEAIEIIQKNGKTFYRLKNSKGGKMFITAYNRAIKGDARWADFLVKMGFAGGYEPTKTDNTTKIIQTPDLSKLTDQELEVLNKINDNTN